MFTSLIGNGRGFLFGVKMELTLGDKIKINGEEVPEYLLKALRDNINVLYPQNPVECNGKIITSSIEVNKFNVSQNHIPQSA
ncbi:Uncharacterised protein [[Pasteurella] aerogenes]|nr:Uncharacterised protein [[Pasteurella] aerogenes]